jgi:hypothetical protein
MNSFLLNRELGSIGPQALERAHTTDLVQSLQPSAARFQKLRPRAGGVDDDADSDEPEPTFLVHNGGVNSIAIDRFEGRYLLSGGGDGVISMWDLEACPFGKTATHRPLGSVLKYVSIWSVGVRGNHSDQTQRTQRASIWRDPRDLLSVRLFGLRLIVIRPYREALLVRDVDGLGLV